MTPKLIFVLTIFLGIGLMERLPAVAENNRTLRGWFVDEACTRERVKAGKIEPDNPECAKRCVKEGSRLMFLSETNKALLEIKDPAAQAQNIGYYVEVAGTTDDKKVLTVNAVKRLSAVNPSCERQRSR